MSKQKDKAEGNKYDKIFKENINAIVFPFLAKHYHIKIETDNPINAKLQTTKEVETDNLYYGINENDEKIIVHLEYQTENDLGMISRMKEYNGIIDKKFQLPIHHIVFYFGNNKPTMLTKLPENRIFKGFHLINFKDLDYKTYLNSEIPEELLLTILGNYQKEQSEAILRYVIERLFTICETKAEKIKFFNQLKIIAKLRNLDELTIKLRTEMPIIYDIKKDAHYLRGVKDSEEKIRKANEIAEKAIENAQKEKEIAQKEKENVVKAIEKMNNVIKNQLKSGLLTVKQIAETFELEEDYVKNLKKQI